MVNEMNREHIKKGLRVKYNKNNSRYGWLGTIMATGYYDTKVQWDSGIVQNYSTPSFYLQGGDKNGNEYLELFKEVGTNHIEGDLVAVGVTFEGRFKRYIYKVNRDDTNQMFINCGDKVVVDSPENGYVCVLVTSLLDEIPDTATKYVVSTIDDGAYKQLTAKLKREAIQKKMKDLELELEGLNSV